MTTQNLWQANIDAGKAVCGTVWNERSKRDEPRLSDGWSERFAAHEAVRNAVRDGYEHQLRVYLVHAVRRRLIDRQSWLDLDNLIPPKSMIEFWRERADINRKAAEWRTQRIPHVGQTTEAP